MSKLLAMITVVLSAVSIYSQNSYELNKRGLKSFQRGEYDSAIVDFTHAIELSSKLTTKTSAGLFREVLECSQTVVLNARPFLYR